MRPTAVEFPGLPSFAPELFTGARVLDTGKTKQFKRGLEVLEEIQKVQTDRSDRPGTDVVINSITIDES